MDVTDITLTIGGTLVATYDNISAAGGSAGTFNMVPGTWYNISIDYKNRAGSDGMSLTWNQPGDVLNGGYGSVLSQPFLVPLADFRSTNSQGQTISGLTAQYYDLSGNLQSTVYGEGPLNAINNEYENTPGLSWNGEGYFSLFEEKLTGQIMLPPTQVTGTSQTIMFPGIGCYPASAQAFTCNATASSGLPVTYSVLSGPALVSGNTVVCTGAGLVTIAADQAGNTTYAPAPEVTQTFTVTATSPDPSPLNGLSMGGNWFYNIKFGYYNTALYPWINHNNLGYFNLTTSNNTDLYLTVVNGNPSMGILYTTPTELPNFYSFSEGTWLYYQIGTPYFYNYTNQAWETY